MERRDFLRATSAAAAGLALAPQLPARQPQTGVPRPWGAPFDSPPVLQNPAPDGVTVVVAVNAASTAWVEYGTTDKLGERAGGAVHGLHPFNARVHHVRLEGLLPATKYFYRVMACPIGFRSAYKISRGAAIAGRTYSFTTLDEGRGRAAQFAVINDTHERPDTLRGVTAALMEAAPQLTFWNGDIFNDIRSDEQIVGQVLRSADAPYAAGTPLCFVSGNHDVRGVHARCLDWFLPAPDGRRYSLRRLGPVALLTLDTGEDKPDGHSVYAGLNDFAAYRTRQQRWLEGVVQTEAWRSAAFRVALLHIPLWGKAASEDSRTKWHGVLSDGGLDVAISGHVHEYKYTPAGDNHRYAQLVGGGPNPESATVIHARADARALGLLVHDLNGREIGNYELRA